jgi:hypothetical protein
VNTPTKTLVFNTGRQYSPAGQRIAAAQLEDGSILFVDIDRGLEYLIAPGAASFTQDSIMAAYDIGGLEFLEHWRAGPAMDRNIQIAEELSAAAAAQGSK